MVGTGRLGPALSAALGGSIAFSVLQLMPALKLALFARVAAEGASLFTGAPVIAMESGWLLSYHQFDLLVSDACSGTDFFIMLSMLLCWRLGKRNSIHYSISLGLLLALIGALAINSLRVILVAQTSRLQLALLPEDYRSFAHLLLGIAVFLPALVIVNFIFDLHDRQQSATATPDSN